MVTVIGGHVDKTSPFLRNGMYFASTMFVRLEETATSQRYVRLFVCMLTRDVHAELIYFTITGRVIQKLRRFLAWREHRIYWRFISEKAVWMGSYWERTACLAEQTLWMAWLHDDELKIFLL
ncbi:hypothetical protein T4E_2562 [Trichinella pseudospiralis]|uniref:Uncharacterized protein n=1 Tax=Trichinella pseudospiralis TaxID=6337 RepID=A0A0V0XYN6_TRIPS|nr:hypothetical protein T4E_2562 [Trichinella pseudospiralis]